MRDDRPGQPIPFGDGGRERPRRPLPHPWVAALNRPVPWTCPWALVAALGLGLGDGALAPHLGYPLMPLPAVAFATAVGFHTLARLIGNADDLRAIGGSVPLPWGSGVVLTVAVYLAARMLVHRLTAGVMI